MDIQDYKEVYFDEYCKTCKYEKEAVTEDSVCDDCLDNPINLYSHKPVNWEEGAVTQSSKPDIKPYTEVEYLESDRNQFINTGVVVKTTMDYEFVGSITENTSTSWIVGAPTWIGIHKKAGTVAITQTSSGHTYHNVGINEIFKLGVFGNKVRFNGVETDPITRVDSTLPLFIFAYHNKPNVPAMHSVIRLYSFKMWDNGKLILDFIPVLDLEKKPCLYDKVSGKFFYNQGTGEFITKTK